MFHARELTYQCKRKDCLSCHRLYLHQEVTRAVANSNPENMLTLTGLPPEWKQAKPQLDYFRRVLSRQGNHFPSLTVIERNPNDYDQAHAHLLTHGRIPDRAILSTASVSAGMGHQVHTRSLSRPMAAANYLFKTGTWNEESHLDYQVLNGPRLTVSGAFWRSGATGRQHPTLAQAVRAANEEDRHRRRGNGWSRPLGDRLAGSLIPAMRSGS